MLASSIAVVVAPLFLTLAACGQGTTAPRGALDGGTPADAGTAADAGMAADAGTAADAGMAADAGAVADAGCSASRLSACDYPSRGSSFAVRMGISVEDNTTGRSLPLLVRAPAGAGPVPVVIWSHGGGLTTAPVQDSPHWGELLARHGYAVLHVTHTSLSADAASTICGLAQIPTAECSAVGDDDDNGLLAVIRTFDLAAVLDDLPRLSQLSVNNGGPALALDKVALGGWSGGSRGPMILMGATVQPTPGAPLFAMSHARPAAAFIMSPTGPGFGGFYENSAETSWDDMRGPFYMATGQNDVKPLKPTLNGPVRRRPFETQPADGQRRLLYSNLAVGVGGHGTYNLEDEGSPDGRLARLSRAIGSVARAFLDASLRGDAAADAWLASANARVLAGEADWVTR